ncbi:hypothetical protein FA15DRAFT_576377, partial [Coprinopsis marcescibilis]
IPMGPISKSTTSSIANMLKIEPQSVNEVHLLAALQESEAANQALHKRVIQLQASQILNEAYCNKLRHQLAQKEEKKGKKGRGKLLRDGLPQLMSGNAFFEKVVEFTELQKAQ